MTTTQIHFTLRLATTTDIPILHELIESSVRGLQSNDYSPHANRRRPRHNPRPRHSTHRGQHLLRRRNGKTLRQQTHRSLRRLEQSQNSLRQRSRPQSRKRISRSRHGRCQNSRLLRSSGLGSPRPRLFAPRNLRNRRQIRRLHSLRNGFHSHRSPSLPGPRLQNHRAHRSPPPQRRLPPRNPHVQIHLSRHVFFSLPFVA